MQNHTGENARAKLDVVILQPNLKRRDEIRQVSDEYERIAINGPPDASGRLRGF